MNMDSAYGIKRTVNLTFDQAQRRVRQTLQDEGFGVLTEIDVQGTLKAKINQDFTPYLILGACNPGLAHQALSEEIDMGLLLPCNVVVYEHPDSGDTIIAAVDPQTMLATTGRKDLQEFAKEVRDRLKRALESV